MKALVSRYLSNYGYHISSLHTYMCVLNLEMMLNKYFSQKEQNLVVKRTFEMYSIATRSFSYEHEHEHISLLAWVRISIHLFL